MPDLMRHQREAVTFFEGRSTGSIFFDRGLGKTATILTILNRRISAGRKFLYVAPKSTLGSVAAECGTWAPGLTPIILSPDRKKRTATIADVRAQKLSCPLLITNYETMRNVGVELALTPWEAVVMDESSKIKNRKSQQSRTAKMIARNAASRWILTGYPVTESLEDAWAQFDFLAPGQILHSNFYAFRNYFCILGGWQKKEIIGYRNMDHFMRKISAHSIAAKKEDCLDLPAKVYQVLETELGPNQKKAYAAIEDHIRVEFTKGELTVTSALAETGKLMQVAAGFVYDDEGVAHFMENEKVGTLLEFLESHPGKVVIFTTFRAERECLARALAEAKVAVISISAEDDATTRTERVAQFQAEKHTKVFLSDVRVGGIGITLTAADSVVFHSNPFSLELRVQAEDRVHRIGSQIHKKINVIDVIAKGTVDEGVRSALVDKRAVADSIINGILGAGAFEKLKSYREEIDSEDGVTIDGA